VNEFLQMLCLMLVPSHLVEYLRNTPLVSAGQFILLALIFHLVFYRSLRRVGWIGDALRTPERVANDLVESLVQLNVGLGLLLTFSGVYGLIGSGGGTEDGNWPLLLALGSSALGYSGYAACALGSVLDSVGKRERVTESAPVPEPPPPYMPMTRGRRGVWRLGKGSKA